MAVGTLHTLRKDGGRGRCPAGGRRPLPSSVCSVCGFTLLAWPWLPPRCGQKAVVGDAGRLHSGLQRGEQHVGSLFWGLGAGWLAPRFLPCAPMGQPSWLLPSARRASPEDPARQTERPAPTLTVGPVVVASGPCGRRSFCAVCWGHEGQTGGGGSERLRGEYRSRALPGDPRAACRPQSRWGGLLANRASLPGKSQEKRALLGAFAQPGLCSDLTFPIVSELGGVGGTAGAGVLWGGVRASGCGREKESWPRSYLCLGAVAGAPGWSVTAEWGTCLTVSRFPGTPTLLLEAPPARRASRSRWPPPAHPQRQAASSGHWNPCFSCRETGCPGCLPSGRLCVFLGRAADGCAGHAQRSVVEGAWAVLMTPGAEWHGACWPLVGDPGTLSGKGWPWHSGGARPLPPRSSPGTGVTCPDPDASPHPP
ncbi:uncharacterized protein LOC116572864 isoform X2 [Mustela erminea]|uniref:uncharacterized protein LOC116572864 isoform X2 n=1 Tax=Mustela erminea TaxID=36723 RepID=UPI001386F2CC|nr:uncharacterized protein LOC116572864 isoform X2 [Mustela erminea]